MELFGRLELSAIAQLLEAPQLDHQPPELVVLKRAAVVGVVSVHHLPCLDDT